MKKFTKALAFSALFAFCVSASAQQNNSVPNQASAPPAVPAVQKIKLNEWVTFKDAKWSISVDLVCEPPAEKPAAKADTSDTPVAKPAPRVFTEIRVYRQSLESGKLMGGKVTTYTVATTENNYLTVVDKQGKPFTIEKKTSQAHAKAIDYIDAALASAYNDLGKRVKIVFK